MSELTLELPGRGKNPRNSEGAFVALGDGRILFAYSRYRGKSWADDARADIAARYSSDGGRTWSGKDRILVRNEGGRNVMSVSLLRFPDGRIAMFYLRKNSVIDCRPWMRVSEDEGESWSEPRLCIDAPGYYCLLNDQAVQLRSGRLILPVSYHRPLSEVEDTEIRLDTRSSAHFFLSDDLGATWREARDRWTLPVRSRSGMQEPGVVELRGGRLYGWARTSTGRQWEMRSRDGGETWSPPEPSRFRSPLSPMSIKRIPQTGDLAAVWNDLTPRWGAPKKSLANGWAPKSDSSWGRTPLVVAVSGDEGKTWRHARAIETDPDRGFCYVGVHFTDDAMLLAYCCGGRGSAVLQDLCVRRVEMEELYG